MSVERSLTNSREIRAVEYTLFIVAALLGSITPVLTMLAEFTDRLGFGGSDPLAASVVALFGLALAVFILFGVVWAVALFRDAKHVGATDLDWSPSPLLYAVGSLLTAIVPLYYLYKRHEHLPTPVKANRWWYGIVAFVVVALLNAVVFVLTIAGVLAGAIGSSALLVSGLSLLTTAATVVLPVAIYRDAGHLRTIGSDWAPNPVEYFVAVLVGFVIPVIPIPLFVSGYYLYQRRAHAGVP